MPYYVAIAIKTDEIDRVSEALEQLTGTTREGHESMYLGEYDLFRLPEEVVVKYNFVWGEDEWGYPEHRDYLVLIVAESTERPDYIVSAATELGFESKVIKNEQW
jgi:hypothetical protein